MSRVRAGAESQWVAVVLAAGRGTRMRSSLPKVLHPVAGRPMLEWVLRAVREAGCEKILVIVGHGADEVKGRLDAEDITWVLQREQRGTGHALAQASSHVQGAARLLVVSGDVPLVSAGTLTALAAAPGWGAIAIAELEEPGSLGRVLSADGEHLDRIVEASDASAAELAERRINAGLYVLPAPDIFERLDSLRPDNAKGELYLTDALGAAAADGERVSLVPLADPTEGFGANDRIELARLHRRLLERKADELMRSGVTILDSSRTTIEADVEVGRDTVLHPGVSLLGSVILGERCEIQQGAWLRDCRLGDDVKIEPYSVLEGARIDAGATVGPMARLRPGAVVGAAAKIGNFVEIKNSRLAEGVKVGHLAYVGDADVGAGSNLGAGVVTCNYDGRDKHRTEIGENVFVGSDTQLVAPVVVGDGATTGAGSVITKDVPPGALAVERGPQRTVENWRRRRRQED